MVSIKFIRGIKKTKKVNGNIIEYQKCVLPVGTFFVLECPRYLQDAIEFRYGGIFGVSALDYGSILIKNEEGIVEIYNEIKKGRILYSWCHRGQHISKIDYDDDNNLTFVEVCVYRGNRYYADFLVSHSEKIVYAYKKYSNGKRYAKKMGYNYILMPF